MLADRFAGRLRELRAQAGLSQKELADKAGIVLSAVGHLEAGRRSPSWETVLALCAALGVDCTAFTIEPKETQAPQRGRPRKSDADQHGQAGPSKRVEDKPAPKSRKRK
ncbi:MAG TPA: helix-turn-helix transcriptional regulator [Gemmataceae bacterium]|jgi:transcriptional regulator with XRE-family HTH domain